MRREERAIQWTDRPKNGLAPHRWRSFKLSNDPAFAEELRAIVGLYVASPAHAVVLSVDESEPRSAPLVRAPRRTQIQALHRTQPGLPLKKGRGATMTHDYKRHGTSTLFAALNVLTGEVVGRNMQRHRHQGFIRCLNALEREIPAGKVVHVIVDSLPRRPPLMVWMAPLAHRDVPVGELLSIPPRGAIHGTAYHYRPRLGEICLSGARR